MADITVGTNSYVSLDTANDHFASRLYATSWTSADDDTKAKALITAAILLDRHIVWIGHKNDPEQAMEWPRACVDWLSDTQVPTSVMVAQMELALILLDTDTTALPDTAGMKSLEVAGVIKMTMDPSDRVKPIPDSIYSLIRVYGSRSGGLSTIQLTRR